MAIRNAVTALERLRADFDKEFGAGTMSVGQRNRYEVIPTGSLALDYAMGCGGLILGRVVEAHGLESTGKTTMALRAIASAQRLYPRRNTAFFDVERTLDLDWARAHGVDTAKMILVQPKTAEQVADMMHRLVVDFDVSLVVLDSIGAMLPREEYEKAADQATVGTIAKIITRMVKILAGEAEAHRTAALLINQVRAIIGPRGGTTRPGGFALTHVSTHRLRFGLTGARPITVGTDHRQVIVGREVAVKVEKNKVASPGRVAQIRLLNQDSKHGALGINPVDETWTYGVMTGVIARNGAYATLPDGTTKQGEDKIKAHLIEHPELLGELRTRILATLAGEVHAVDDEGAEAPEVDFSRPDDED